MMLEFRLSRPHFLGRREISTRGSFLIFCFERNRSTMHAAIAGLRMLPFFRRLLFRHERLPISTCAGSVPRGGKLPREEGLSRPIGCYMTSLAGWWGPPRVTPRYALHVTPATRGATYYYIATYACMHACIPIGDRLDSIRSTFVSSMRQYQLLLVLIQFTFPFIPS